MSKEAPALDAIRVAKLLDVLGLLGAAELRVEAGDKFAARPVVFDPACNAFAVSSEQ